MKYYFIISLFFTLMFFVGCKSGSEGRKFESGVSLKLAQERFADISEVEYLLEMHIPDSLKEKIQATATISFQKKNLNSDIVLDFTPGVDAVKSVTLNDKKVFYKVENEHLIIPDSYVEENKIELEIEFVMGEGALNRNDDYLYSLFVPDRARTAIPCFDQPDIKAKVAYSIYMPVSWYAITNGVKDFEEKVIDGYKHVSYTYSKPISTYLWAFAAGKFSKAEKVEGGRKIAIYHMVSDSAKLKNNIDALFSQAFHSINWLEKYTGIDFPFQKYTMVCIPSFQFGGMEHPGAVYYRQEKCFLSEHPTQKELLQRANLIAHETSHMWFGDLVTMKWFSGVWQKEVFANFIADKIVKEQFPDINHDLAFLISHFPAAFSVDRTKAANPIEQKLDNLANAASLYGSIIYHKAPIVMNQLEQLMGEDMLQKGLGLYLKKYSYGNASWKDLMGTLNDLSEYDLNLWSDTWVNKSGRPVINFEWKDDELTLNQHSEFVDNVADSNKVWAQRFNYASILRDSITKLQAELLSTHVLISDNKPDYILPSIDKTGYGLFLFDSLSTRYAMNHLAYMKDELLQGAVLIHLNENLLAGKIDPLAYIKMLEDFIDSSDNEQLINLACDQLYVIYWRCIDSSKREMLSGILEDVLLNKVQKVTSVGLKKVLITTWTSITLKQEGLDKIKRLVFEDKNYDGVEFSERELASMLLSVVMKDASLDDAAVYAWADGVKDVDVKGKLNFIAPLFSKDDNVFRGFVQGLHDVKNRAKENWVLTALSYLHHPYLDGKNMKYIEEQIALMPELKETGSLFFPMSWINVILRGYNSTEVVSLVEYYFKDHYDFPEDLKMKVLQAEDMVGRSARILGQ